MGAITDLSDLVNRATGGSSGTPENIFFFKESRTSSGGAAATVAGRYTSLWQYIGSPSHGVAPGGTVVIPDNTTAGGLRQTDPGGGRQKWLTAFSAVSQQVGTLILYDRLLSISGLSGTVTTAQTVGGTLTRYTGTESIGNQIWAEIYTAIGATARTITASYTDQDGNTGTTSSVADIGGTGLSNAQRMIPISLASGDTGVQAVASVTLSASTGTAGDFGINIIRPLAYLPLPITGCGQFRDFISGTPGPVEIKTDACLALMWLPNSTTAPYFIGNCHFLEA